MTYTKKLETIRAEVLQYIILMTKSYKKIIIKGKCVLQYKDNQVMHSNIRTEWISLDIQNERYSTDYLCKIADYIYKLKN